MSENLFTEFYGAKSKFVYYNDLQRTHPSTYASLKAEGQVALDSHSSKMLSIASTLYGWANQEAIKEIELLKQYFNVGSLALTPDQLYTSDIGRRIIDAMNVSMQLKDTYERHLNRIAGTNDKAGAAKITAAQFFADYFADELGKLVTAKYSSIEDVSSLTMKQLGDQLFSDDIIKQALYNALFVRLKNSGDMSSKDTQKGYQELFAAIERFNKDSFLKSISAAYHLDELKEKFIKEQQSTEQIGALMTSGKSKVKKTMRSTLGETTSAKGTLAEIFSAEGINAVQSLLAEQIKGFQGGSARVVGNYKGKTDVLMTFGIDYNQIMPIIEQHYHNRAETVTAYKQLNSYLANLKQGFIVYTNAKDYSLIKNKGKGGYFFQGFSAGSSISLANLEGVIHNTPGGSQELIGQIMSTMEGAVYSDLKEQLEEELCEKMAYFLFDDVLTIGKDTSAASHAIHLLMLDGVYIPLSYLFFLMARAIEEVERDPDDIFKVTITPGAIAFPEGPWGPGKWAEQKKIAYSQIKIGATFLKSFVNVISEIRS